jgi:cytochrome b561
MNNLQNNNPGYGKVHKLLHWLLALNIGATLIFLREWTVSKMTSVSNRVAGTARVGRSPSI